MAYILNGMTIKFKYKYICINPVAVINKILKTNQDYFIKNQSSHLIFKPCNLCFIILTNVLSKNQINFYIINSLTYQKIMKKMNKTQLILCVRKYILFGQSKHCFLHLAKLLGQGYIRCYRRGSDVNSCVELYALDKHIMIIKLLIQL